MQDTSHITAAWRFVPSAHGAFRIEAPGAGIAGGTLLLAMAGPVFTVPANVRHSIGRQMTQAGRMRALLQRLVDADLTHADFAIPGHATGVLLAHSEAIADARQLLEDLAAADAADAADCNQVPA